MNSIFIICLYSLFMLAIDSQENPGEENIIILNKDNFNSILETHNKLFVEFYSPWCGHCKSMAPEIAKAATRLKEENSDISIAKMDATAEPELSERFHIQGYPTFKFFYEDKILNYTAGRSSNDIVNWLMKKTGPSALEITDSLRIKQLIVDQDFFLVGFYKDRSSLSFQAYSQYAFDNDDMPCYATASDDVFTEFQVTEDALVAFKKFDDMRADLKGSITIPHIKSFISENRLPLVSEFSQSAAEKIFGGEIKNYAIYFADKDNDTTFSDTYNGFRIAASAFKGKVVFMYVNIAEEDHMRILEFLGIRADECPTVRYVTLGDDLIKYKPFSKDMSQQGMELFVQKVLDGTIKPHLKSDDVPADWDEKAVKVLVASNFNTYLKSLNKNLLVEFYAPWCGHCKRLDPIWEELAETLKGEGDIVVAKMDATSNEIEDLPIKSFPTIKYFGKNGGEVTDYTGERDLESLLKFVKAGGKNQDDSETTTAKETKDEL